ncbi:MAG: CsgG/HfaB family protein [Planctomycetota bacterium]
MRIPNPTILTPMVLTLALAAVLGLPAAAQTTPGSAPGKATLGVMSVTVTPAIDAAMRGEGNDKYASLRRTADSMGQQLIDRVHNTRKFSVVSRSDLETLLKDQELQAMLSNPSDANVARAFEIAGCKYALITTIDDFQDVEEVLRGEGGIVLATKRVVRLSAVAKIYDTTTGLLLESANFQLSNVKGEEEMFGREKDGDRNDAMMTSMAREMAQRAADRVLDVIYPAKIIAMTGKTVTINRGDGTGIAADQIWDVFALGEALIDPDTGENLGTEEVLIGTVKITAVTPKFSRATITEDFGIEKSQVLRLNENATAAALGVGDGVYLPQ